MAENSESPDGVGGDQTLNTEAIAQAALSMAKSGLAKLPILGPALWLYARDPVRKYMFVGDIDWMMLPPVVLEQCRLYSRDELPCAFFTWALVSEHVAQRLRSGVPKIAPNEWRCGEELWIIDAVAPFGQMEEMLRELRETVLAGRKVHALIPDAATPGIVSIKEYEPAEKPALN